MDNISEALYMAGSVLIFIIALTVAISSFTTVRTGIDNMLGQTETVKMAKDGENYINFINSRNAEATRIVGAETIIASIYRTLKENYVVYIQFEDQNIYSHLDSESDSKLTIFEGKDGKKILKITLKTNDDMLKTENDSTIKNLYKELTTDSRQFCEYLGEYQYKAEDVDDANKDTYRIVTYREVNT